MKHAGLLRLPTVWGLLLFSTSLVPAGEFVPLGFTVGSSNWAHSYLNVSEDGSVVVGCNIGAEALYRWTRDQGTVTFFSAYGADVTGDGTTMVTTTRYPGHAGNIFLKVSDNGEEEASPVPAGYKTWGYPQISQDGTTVVGVIEDLEDTAGRYVTRWTDEGVSVLHQGFLTAVSATGGVLVGYAEDKAWRWTEESGKQNLPSLTPDSQFVKALGVSSDGRWTVGSEEAIVDEPIPVRWDGFSPPEPLSFDKNRWAGCSPRDVTADGSLVVGSCSLPSTAVLWTAATGMVSLQDVLVNDYGLGKELEGWSLSSVYDITDDGRFLVGHGTHGTFLVDLSPNLPGDFNADGRLDAADIDELSVVVREGSHPERFDVTDDDLVNNDDRAMWVHELKHTYFGDANLDGEFNTGDFVQVFEAGKYETQQYAGWAEGDWNGDGVFDTGDFVIAFEDGGYERGLPVHTVVVPEPSSVLLVIAGFVGVAIYQLRLHGIEERGCDAGFCTSGEMVR